MSKIRVLNVVQTVKCLPPSYIYLMIDILSYWTPMINYINTYGTCKWKEQFRVMEKFRYPDMDWGAREGGYRKRFVTLIASQNQRFTVKISVDNKNSWKFDNGPRFSYTSGGWQNKKWQDVWPTHMHAQIRMQTRNTLLKCYEYNDEGRAGSG